MKLLESRPTPINKPEVKQFADDLVEELLLTLKAEFDQDEPLDERDELLKTEFHVNDVKTGELIKFPVYVRSVWDDGSYLFAGAGAGKVNGEFLVELLINGKYTPRRYQQRDFAYQLKSDFYDALIHEITHAADARYDNSPKPKYYRADNTIDDNAYHNEPREVRAFMQEAVEEALRRAEHRRGESRQTIIDYATSGRMVQRLKRYMTPKNMARVLKAIYVALEEAGYLGSEETKKKA